jgi:hypothetical protein
MPQCTPCTAATKKFKKRYLTFLVIKELKTDTAMRCPFVPTMMATIKKDRNSNY